MVNGTAGDNIGRGSIIKTCVLYGSKKPSFILILVVLWWEKVIEVINSLLTTQFTVNPAEGLNL